MQDWHAIEALRWVGLLSLAVILASGVLPILKIVHSPSQSISQLWASAEKHHRMVSVILTIFGVGLCAYAIGWLIPTYHLWTGMYPITLAGYVAILCIAWFPMIDNPGEHSLRHPHFIGGATAACGAIVGYSAILGASGGTPQHSHYLTVVALVYTAMWPMFFLQGIRRYFLILETIIVALFTAVITALTFGW